MSNLQICSDLHLEFLNRWNNNLLVTNSGTPEILISSHPDADILILAGDIGNSADACKLFSGYAKQRMKEKKKACEILMVAGNHEFYGHSIDPIYEKLREQSKLNNIYFLENDRVDIGGIRFLGCTLWTDYRLPGLNRTQRQLMEVAENSLNDHRLIRIDGKRFSTQDALDRHEVSRAWLEAELIKPFDGKTVVITHHAPHSLSIAPQYIGDALNAAFASDLSELMPHVDYWVHGHTHSSVSYQIDRCKVIANPAGYVENRGSAMTSAQYKFENKSFKKNLVIKVD